MADPFEFKLVSYFARSSFASIGSEPVDDQATLLAIESNFQRRMVKADLSKCIFSEIENADYDIFIVDFIDERFNVLLLNENQLVTVSNEYKKANLGKYNGRVISWNSAEKFSHWKVGFDKLIEKLKSSGNLHKLKILKVLWSSSDTSGEKSPNYTIEFIEENNNYLLELYSYVASKIGTGYFVDFADEDFKSDPNHRWGLEPFHYAAGFYRKVLSKIYFSGSGSNFIDISQVRNSRSLSSYYKEISKNQVKVERGRQLIEHNIMHLPFFEKYELPQEIDWEVDPFTNRTWQWQLNWFAFISDLIAFDIDCPDQINILKAVTFIKSWGYHYLENPKLTKFEFAWHDHGSAKRAEQVLLLIYHIDIQHPNFFNEYPDVLFYLSFFLHAHADFLFQEKYYSEHTNHGLEQARVLLLLSVVYKKSFYSVEWKSKSIDRLNSELTFSFTDEGVHVENSPAYHYFVLKIFLMIISDYVDYDLGELTSEFNSIARKALNFLTFIIHPDSKLPIIGDTEAIKIGDVFESYFSKFPEYKNFKYAHSQGRLGIAPSKNYLLCQRSGYGIIRNRWSNRTEYTNDSHLIFKAGSISQYHSQQDDGSIIYYSRGEHWLVDSGMYNHNRAAPIRKYMRSRSAHNVVHIANKKYPTKWDLVRDSWNLDFTENSDVLTSVLTSNIYQDIELRRQIDCVLGVENFEVTDTITLPENASEKVEIFWHFDSNKFLEIIDANKILVRSNQSAHCMLVEIESNTNIEIVYWKGQHPVNGMSVISRTKNKSDDTYTVKLILNNVSGICNVVTKFRFCQENTINA